MTTTRTETDSFGPLEVPLVVLMGISFFAGFAVAVLGVIRKSIKGRNRRAANMALDLRRQY